MVKNEYAFRQWSANRYESYPITADDMNQYYSQYNDDALYILTATDENEITGHITIRFIDDARKVARLGFVIVDDSKTRQRLRKAALVSSALNYTFNELKADKVTLGVFENNDPAVHCYQSCGFKIVKKK